MNSLLKIKKNLKFNTNYFIFGLITLTSFSLSVNQMTQHHAQVFNQRLMGQQQQTSTTVQYVDWKATSASKRIIDVFPLSRLATRVLDALKAAETGSSSKYDLGVNSVISKDDLKKVKSLDLSDLNLTEIDAILNPDLTWDHLWNINLSNNNFGNYEIKFDKTKMPKLYKILASNAHLNKMINVSSYVKDPNDESAENSDDRTAAQAQYTTPIRENVPRFFDLASNNIREIPKYFLKINLAYLNMSNNKLGSGTEADPMGIYATPWYSLKQTENNTGLLPIQDPNIRGPYGINVYNSGDKKADNPSQYKYTDEQVARWRQSPWPIRGLTFGNYNDVPTKANNALDTGITKGTGMTADTGGKAPFFSFSNNNLVAPMVFRNTNVTFNSNSSTSPQQKSVNLYIGLKDFEESAYKKAQETIIATAKSKKDDNNPNANAELLVPQPDSIFPFMGLNGWTTGIRPGYNFARPLLSVYSFRSFNGFGLLEQNEDSRTNGEDGNEWDNMTESTPSSSRGDSPTASEPQQNMPDPYAGTTAKSDGNGISWKVPKLSDFGKKGSDGTWTGLYNPNERASNAPTLEEFINGTNNGEKSGFWGTKGLVTVMRSNQTGRMSFDTESDQTYWKRYKPFRTYLITAKSFAKSERGADYQPVFDGNVFYDARNYENFNARLNFSPSGRSEIGLMANYAENPINLFNKDETNKVKNRNVQNSIKHFGSIFGNLPIVNLTVGTPVTWVSNIGRDSSFGVTKNTPVPYTSSLVMNNGLYNYSSYFNVVDNIATELKTENNFSTQVAASVDNGLNLSEYQNKFPQNVRVDDILDGQDKFWKSTKKFDQVYMERLNQNDVKLTYNPEAGSLNYKFRIYSPGYSRQGRLLQTDDPQALASKDSTPTIDVKIDKTVTGFAKAQIQKEDDQGIFTGFTSESIANNLMEYDAPKSAKAAITTVTDYSKINAALIAKTFKTNYLGNKMIPGSQQSEIENDQHVLTEVNAQWITEIIKNQVDGTVQFKVEIPDYTFANGTSFNYPTKLKTAVYKWTGLPKTNTIVIGKNIAVDDAEQTFVEAKFSNDADRLKKFKEIIAKPASAITAQDIFNLGAVSTDVSTWNDVNATNAHNYFSLFPNDANGTLLWQVKIPGDLANGIPEQRITVLWEHLFNQTTTVTWKTQEQLNHFLLGKTPAEIEAAFKTNPQTFLNVLNKPNNNQLTANDLEVAANNFITNTNNGQIRFTNIRLKNHFLNGIKYNNGQPDNKTAVAGTPPTYLTIPISPNYQGQRPISSLKWESDENIIKNIKDYLEKNNLVQTDPNNDQATTVKEVLNQMNVYDLKQAIVNNNLNLTDMKLFKLENINKNNFAFKSKLSESLVADNKTGNLTFQNLQFQNWQNANSFETITHDVPVHIVKTSPVVNSFIWSKSISSALANKSVLEVEQIFGSPNLAPAYIDALNVGKKTFNANNVSENHYRVDPTKIQVDLVAGTITFAANAITMTNYVSTAGQDPVDHVVTEVKTYSLPNKYLTSFQVNANITSAAGFKDDYAKFYFGYSYSAAGITPAQKQAVDDAVAALKTPNLVHQTTQVGSNLIRRWLVNNNAARINPIDLARVNELKKSSGNTFVQTTDFSGYFYLPNYLAFVNSAVASGINRTYFIAERIEASTLDSSILIIRKPHIVNYLANGSTELHPVNDFIYVNFLRNGTTVSFHKYVNQKVPEQLSQGEFSANLLAPLWHDVDAVTMKADLEFLTVNRKNLSVRASHRWRSIQQAWISTFRASNVPYGGSYDTTIVYPAEIEISNGERTLKVNKLIFALYANTTDENSPVVPDYEIEVAEIWYLNTGANTEFIRNPFADYEDILNQPPSLLLQRLGLKLGMQTDPTFTFNQFLKAKVYHLRNATNSVLTNDMDADNIIGPVGQVGQISLTGNELRLSQMRILTPWTEGTIGPTLNLSDIVLPFAVSSTELLPNNNPVIIAWLQNRFGTKPSVSELLFDFQNALQNNQFTEVEFNEMLKVGNGLLFLNSVFNDPATQARLTPKSKLTDSVLVDHIKGTISLKNLQILNGYLDNVPQNNKEIEVPEIDLVIDTAFTTQFDTNFHELNQDADLNQLTPSEIQNVLSTNQPRLHSLVRFADDYTQIEQPEITVSANDLLGKLYIQVHFQNYYENGINLGRKTFNYTLTNFKNQLPLVLGPVFGGSGGISLVGLIAYFWRRKYLGSKKFYMANTAVKVKK
ncbi:hypothetical protein J2Z62_000817 [Mycoplasmoides fastidiosum]|uniref:Cell surface protein SprA n=1 Tax=Mycoplasmoides fastidiosum TaxID=92758 RepID=A0ABU0M0B3_9BACT|nr:hypothetical protein [Mycoplasmoides fastidiosum]MDQ0514379.1 hypothetical protein [Mycoplasmoides fastidiosum]UUD38023.1 hypothetical protein NPA10_01350 [Mycoplasmoides fastidiosum]